MEAWVGSLYQAISGHIRPFRQTRLLHCKPSSKIIFQNLKSLKLNRGKLRIETLIDRAKFGVDQKIPYDHLCGPKCKRLECAKTIVFFSISEFRFVLSSSKRPLDTTFSGIGKFSSILKLFEHPPLLRFLPILTQVGGRSRKMPYVMSSTHR